MTQQSQNYLLRGVAQEIRAAETFPSGLVKREIVVNDCDPRYPTVVPVEFVGADRVGLLDLVHPGQPVVVEFFLSGREYGGRRFVSLRGISVRADAGAGAAPGAASPGSAPHGPVRGPGAVSAAPAAPAPATAPAGPLPASAAPAAPVQSDLDNLPF